MRIQLLSDLHLETESFEPRPQPEADVLVLAGDIDSTWRAYERFRDWPVPVLAVAGNHEFDGRDLVDALPQLRTCLAAFGIRMLERESVVLDDPGRDRRIRFVGATRWSDFDLLGTSRRDACVRAAGYFQRVMRAQRAGEPFDALAVRDEALLARAWLERELAQPGAGRWDATVVITHFAPSLACADPRYGSQPSTASFCNADDDLLARATVWLYGHVHARFDRHVGRARVVNRARGLEGKGETSGYEPNELIIV